ncbi:hypothetical protein CO058_03740 [candidate division WWE3 bacterium CG_4_9_14_0_2_um_filter_35_11]|uniref:HD domain-containing protein n=1 Tax=candidate division WWE3 bacterium CG_4_9_14_0_2_um_filter_35_11 TaxID=1975077 RepID=A0A2M8EL22_UNCKA|nr:MAG: hypothetical protein COV25_02440 [candidate division WWE3 bacterium CG10_big_fil_rev_8_21_14_0_10_35_32]PJC23415.1 MAG: hypothetical protein CO058_03740 [candidate division WWE3 bacterium CG_4_9_14_0_2_um_filter_35_11]
MAKTVTISELRIDQRIQNEAFSLKEFEKKVSRVGKYYYNILLGDKTGEIRGKLWSENVDSSLESLTPGEIVSITGYIQEYAGKPQIIAEKITVVTDMAPEEFLPVTSRDRSMMREDLESGMQTVKNPHLKQILDLFWNDESSRDNYLNFPAGMYVHHGYVGGLLEHVWEMWQLSQPFLNIYANLDRDLYFAGLFFHDVGKLEELNIVGATIVMTKEGSLNGHVVQGALKVQSLINQIPDFPEDLRVKLLHLILSHQGHLEFGSPVKPLMLEALILSMVDTNGADMNQATKHIEKQADSDDDFTDYHKQLGRSLYKGS